MDAALLKEREAFKKRAIATPAVENRKKKESSFSNEPPKKKSKQSTASNSSRSKQSSDPFSYKTLPGSSQYRFGMLAKVVKYMKQRHLEGDTYPLSIDEILDETNQLDVGSKQRHWLVTEALVNNPKVVLLPDGKYVYKPAYNIKDKKSLLRLLDKHDQKGMGGIFLEDIQESLHNADKAIKLLGDSLLCITRPIDKKKIMFYNDKNFQLEVDEEFQKLWRSVAVDGIDESKIEEYLEKQGITSMQDQGIKKLNPVPKRRKPSQKKARNFKRHNDHMGDILQDYSDK